MKRKGTHDWWSMVTPPLSEHAQIEKVYAELREEAKQLGSTPLFTQVMRNAPNLQQLPSGRVMSLSSDPSAQFGSTYQDFKKMKLWKAYGGAGDPPRTIPVHGAGLLEESWKKIMEMPLLSIKKRTKR